MRRTPSRSAANAVSSAASVAARVSRVHKGGAKAHLAPCPPVLGGACERATHAIIRRCVRQDGGWLRLQPSLQSTIRVMLSKPTEVLKNILSLSIKLLDPFAHEWMVAEPIELRTKLLGNVFRKRANQKADAPILPDLIIAAQNAPDMWCERNADRGKKGGRGRWRRANCIPGATPQALTKDWTDGTITSHSSSSRPLDIRLIFGNKIVGLIHVVVQGLSIGALEGSKSLEALVFLRSRRPTLFHLRCRAEEPPLVAAHKGHGLRHDDRTMGRSQIQI